jgi:hypothetical protein
VSARGGEGGCPGGSVHGGRDIVEHPYILGIVADQNVRIGIAGDLSAFVFNLQGGIDRAQIARAGIEGRYHSDMFDRIPVV